MQPFFHLKLITFFIIYGIINTYIIRKGGHLMKRKLVKIFTISLVLLVISGLGLFYPSEEQGPWGSETAINKTL